MAGGLIGSRVAQINNVGIAIGYGLPELRVAANAWQEHNLHALLVWNWEVVR